MKVRSFVLEADAAGLRAELDAEIVVEAYPSRIYRARVERVDALAKKRHHDVPVQYFQTTLLPDETDPEVMKPGQRVRGEIVLEEQGAAVVVPPQAIFRISDEDSVFRRDGDRLVATPVVLGPRSLSRVQVLDGIAPGDEVALRDPRESASDAFHTGTSSSSGPAAPGSGGLP
jgi:hypothetical protein